MDALLRVVQATAASQQKMDANQQDLSAQIRALTRTVTQLVEGSGQPLDRQPDSANTDANGDDDHDALQRGRDDASASAPGTRKSVAELVPSLAKIVDAAEKKYFSLQSRATSAKTAALAQQLVADKIVVHHTSASLSKLPDGAPKFLRTIDPKMVGGPPHNSASMCARARVSKVSRLPGTTRVAPFSRVNSVIAHIDHSTKSEPGRTCSAAKTSLYHIHG
eukprot:COSAG03_NODE_5751_length_1182_cov_3.397969_1_plen_221_part_00